MNSIKDTYRFLAALPLLMLAGCAGDDDGQAGSPRQAVGFAIAFGQPTTRADVSTLDNIWPDGSVMTISNGASKFNYKTPDDSSAATAGAAVSLSPVTEGSQFYWPVEDPNWKFTAWFPAADAPTTAITVSADQRLKTGEVTTGLSEADYRAYDLLYCPPTAATFAGFTTVALQLHHQMARVIVNINASLTNGETVTNVAFGGGMIGLAGKITALPTEPGNDKTTWSITDGQTRSVEHMRDRSTDEGKADSNFRFECIVPPQTNAAASVPEFFKISTTGSDEGNREYRLDRQIDLKAGHQYVYTLNISEQGVVSLITLEVFDWTNGGEVANTATIPGNSYPGI